MVTEGYKGPQVVTGGLQGVTRGYKELQVVRGGYNGLQGVTIVYIRLKGVKWG